MSSADPSVDVTKFLEGISYYEVISSEKSSSSAGKISPATNSTPSHLAGIKSTKAMSGHKQALLPNPVIPSPTSVKKSTTKTGLNNKSPAESSRPLLNQTKQTKCAGNAAMTTKCAGNAATTTKCAGNAATTTKCAVNAATTTKCAGNAATTTKCAGNAATTTKCAGNAATTKVAMCSQCNGMSRDLRRCCFCRAALPADALVLDSMVDGEGFRRGGALLVSAVPASPGPDGHGPRGSRNFGVGARTSTPVRVKHTPLRPRSPIVPVQRGAWSLRVGARSQLGPSTGFLRTPGVPVGSFYRSKFGPSSPSSPGPTLQRPQQTGTPGGTSPPQHARPSIVGYSDSDSMDVDEDSDDQQQQEQTLQKSEQDQSNLKQKQQQVRRRYSLTEYQQMSREPLPAAPTPGDRPCFVSGKMAICGECGAYSRNLVRCTCCRQALPVDCPLIETTQGGEGFVRGDPSASPAAATANVKMSSPPIVRMSSQVQINRRNARAAQRRAQEEPECLTISSDDEEAESREATVPPSLFHPGDFSNCNSSSSTIPTTTTTSSSSTTSSDPTSVPPVLTAAPCPSTTDPTTCRGLSIVVRTVRVGSHRCMPSEPVFFSADGFRFQLPTIGAAPRLAVVAVPRRDVTRVHVHLGEQLAAMFVSVTELLAAAIRQQLGMVAQLPGKLSSSVSSAADGSGDGGESAAPGLTPDVPYFDPNSPSEQCRRLTVIFEDPMSPECKKYLMSVLRSLGPERLQEISSDETNAILLRCSPFSNTVSLHSLFASGVSNTLFQYPPAPSAGAIVVTMDDYMCLEEEQFLNDVVIDFYLKYLVIGRLSPQDRQRTHVFSSFFYQRLTTRPRRHLARKTPTSTQSSAGSGDGSELGAAGSDAGGATACNGPSAAQKRHARVKGWTKNVDIFTKDFLLVPINEHSHWFLAIVCFPGLVGCRRLLTDEPCTPPPPLLPQPPSKLHGSQFPPNGIASACSVSILPAVPRASTLSTGTGAIVMKIGSTLVMPVSEPATISRPLSSPSTTLDPPDSDRDEAEPDEDEEAELAPAVPDEQELSGGTPAGDEELEDGDDSLCPLIEPIPPIDYSQADRLAVKQPCILILDSLAGPSRSRVVATLRDYLRIEYAVKKCSSADGSSPARAFDKHSLRGCSVRVPQQDNYTDCGLYVLQYAESFFQFPLLNFHLPLPSLQTDWFPSWRVHNKRRHLSALMRRLSDQQRSSRGSQTPSAGKRSVPASDSDNTVKSVKH